MSHKGTFLGVTTLDHIILMDGMPVPDGKQRASQRTAISGGHAGNASIAFARLGGRAQLISCFGGSAVSLIAQEDLNQETVLCEDICDGDFDFSGSVILVDQQTGLRSVIQSPKRNKPYNLNLLKPDLGDILFIDGFYIEAVREYIAYAKQHNVPIVWDADTWRDDRYLEFIKDVDFVIAGSEFKPPECDTEEDVFNFFKVQGNKQVAITCGNRPILYDINGQRGEIAVPQITAVDTLGAGDVLHGAFCFYYLETGDFVEALTKASLVASKSCEHFARGWVV